MNKILVSLIIFFIIATIFGPAISKSTSNNFETLNNGEDGWNLEFIGMNNEIDIAKGIFLLNDYAFVTEERWTPAISGFSIFDVSNPADPRLVKSYNLGDSIVWSSETNYVYVIDGERDFACLSGSILDDYSSLWIFDVTDPEDSFLIKKHPDHDSIDLVGEYKNGKYILYLAQFEKEKLCILDITDPENPVVLSSIDVNGRPEAVYVNDNYAYLALQDSKLVIIDISDLENPIKVSSYRTPSSAYSVVVKNQYAYVGYMGPQTVDSSLLILDISNLENPAEVSRLYLGYFEPERISFYDTYVYICGEGLPLQVIDVKDPENPVSVGSFDGAKDVFIKKINGEDIVYTTFAWKWGDYDGGIRIFKFTGRSGPPDAPLIEGLSSGKPSQTYNFNATSIDHEGHEIFYIFEWGDGTPSTRYPATGYIESEEKAFVSHVWNEKGEYIVKVKSEDIHGAESKYTEHSINIQKSKSKNSMSHSIFERIFNRCINLLKILFTNILININH